MPVLSHQGTLRGWSTSYEINELEDVRPPLGGGINLRLPPTNQKWESVTSIHHGWGNWSRNILQHHTFLRVINQSHSGIQSKT